MTPLSRHDFRSTPQTAADRAQRSRRFDAGGVGGPVGVGNRVRVDRTIDIGLRDQLRSRPPDPVTVDSAIDDHVGDVDALGAVFAGNALGRGTRSRLAGCEPGKLGSASQRSGRTREDETVATNGSVVAYAVGKQALTAS